MAKERLYHILLWTRDSKDLFLEKKKDRERFLKLLRKARKSGDLKVYAYCLLKDRLQFLCSCPTGMIDKILASAEGVFQSYCQSKYRDKAPVWEQAVYECGWEGLLDLVRYVHRAPVRAEKRKGLWYRWSSHGDYMAGDERWVDYRVVLSVYGKKERAALNRYKRFVRSPAADTPVTIYYRMDEGQQKEDKLPEPTVHEDTKVEAWETYESAVMVEDAEISGETGPEPLEDTGAAEKMDTAEDTVIIENPADTVADACADDEKETSISERIVDLAAALMDVDPASMYKSGGTAQETAARRVALYVLKEEVRLSNAETARVLGMSASTVSRTNNNAALRAELQSRIDQVKQALHG